MSMRFAIIGAGYIGEIHAKAIKNHPEAELVAIVDTANEKAEGFALRNSVASTYNSLEALLNYQIVDAIIIGTPNYLHAQQAISSLRAGLHVFVEKPMAINVEEAELMNQVSLEAGRTLMIGHCWRYDSEVNWLRDQVVSNRIGKVIRTKGYGIHENWGPSGWFTQKKLAGGGALMDMGVHAIDTVRYLLGDPEPESVYARLGTNYGNYDVDDTGVLMINWKSGAVSTIESGWWQPFMDGPEAATNLYGEKGFGSVFPTRLLLPIKGTEQVETVENSFVHPRQEHCEQGMYDRQIAHFISSINEHKNPSSSALVGITNMKIIEAAYQSSQSGNVVKVKSN